MLSQSQIVSTYRCMSPCTSGRFIFWFRGITPAIKPTSELFSTSGEYRGSVENGWFLLMHCRKSVQGQPCRSRACCREYRERNFMIRGVTGHSQTHSSMFEGMCSCGENIRKEKWPVTSLGMSVFKFWQLQMSHLVQTLMFRQISAALALRYKPLQALSSLIISR